jgi:hypothetical protein
MNFLAMPNLNSCEQPNALVQCNAILTGLHDNPTYQDSQKEPGGLVALAKENASLLQTDDLAASFNGSREFAVSYAFRKWLVHGQANP